MSVIPATGCCCGPQICTHRPVCDMSEAIWWNKIRPEYITVGRPKGPTVYPGTYWAAWHNGMSVESKLEMNLELTVVKRTLVLTPCGAGFCPNHTLPAVENCATTGFVSATPDCKKTVYTNNFSWRFDAEFVLEGVNLEQDPKLFYDSEPHLRDFPTQLDPSTPNPLPAGKPVCSVPGGLYPCALTVLCGTGFCASPDDAITIGKNPVWWPGENRKLLPKFTTHKGNIKHTPHVVPSFPQVADCGTVSYVNNCTTSTETLTNQLVCLDFPIVVLPGHSGTMCDGTPSPGCGVLEKELGTDLCLWGFDIKEENLVTHFENLGLADGVPIGTVASKGIWLVKYTDVLGTKKIRFFFNIDRQILAAGGIFRFGTDTFIQENGTATRSRPNENESWWIELKSSYKPRKWCLASPQCDCVQSHAENLPSVLNYEVHAGLNRQCDEEFVKLVLAVGLEDVSIPYWFGVNNHALCTSGPSCSGGRCWEWDNLPEGGEGIPVGVSPSTPHGSKALSRFLGAEPLERGHPFWMRFRQRYNHVKTTNDWWTHGLPAIPGGCQLGVYGNKVGLTKAYFEGFSIVDSPWITCCGGQTTIVGFEKALPPACDPLCCFCTTPHINTVSNCYYCLSPGCYEVKPVSWEDCPPSNPNPGAICGPTTEAMEIGNPDATEGCFAISLFNDCAPNSYHKCGNPQFLQLCGNLSFDSCEVASTTISASLPEIVVVEWDPSNVCSPIGIHYAKTATLNTVCEGPTAWLDSHIFVEVS